MITKNLPEMNTQPRGFWCNVIQISFWADTQDAAELNGFDRVSVNNYQSDKMKKKKCYGLIEYFPGGREHACWLATNAARIVCLG